MTRASACSRNSWAQSNRPPATSNWWNCPPKRDPVDAADAADAPDPAQGFVKKNSEVSVKEHIASIAKQLGDEITIRRFVRFQVGEAVA
jgi:hypothetical protein